MHFRPAAEIDALTVVKRQQQEAAASQPHYRSGAKQPAKSVSRIETLHQTAYEACEMAKKLLNGEQVMNGDQVVPEGRNFGGLPW